MARKEVSVIIPVYNEGAYIIKCLDSCLSQDISRNNVEFILVDGISTDRTRQIINEYINEYPGTFKLLDNKERFTPFALNIGIRNAIGKYIIIMACHSEYASDFVTKSILVSKKTDAEVVGGFTETKSGTYIGKAMSIVLSSKFGVGNSSFRTGGEDGYADTAFCGCSRKEVYEKYGLFDETLIRNQDLEFNKRIINNGGKIYLSNQICLSYYTPDTLTKNLKKAFDNGKWNIFTMITCPGIIGIRHLIPLLFFLSCLVLPLLGLSHSIFGSVFFAEILLYFILNLVFSIKEIKNNTLGYVLMLPVLFFLFHMSYGIGSFAGILSTLKNKIWRKKK